MVLLILPVVIAGVTGWVISNEKFMESTKAWMDFLKIRASWGQNGNCNISNFQYLATIALDDPYYFNNKDNPALGAYPNILPNEDVKWETSEQLDFGFDARFLSTGIRRPQKTGWYVLQCCCRMEPMLLM